MWVPHACPWGALQGGTGSLFMTHANAKNINLGLSTASCRIERATPSASAIWIHMGDYHSVYHMDLWIEVVPGEGKVVSHKVCPLGHFCWSTFLIKANTFAKRIYWTIQMGMKDTEMDWYRRRSVFCWAKLQETMFFYMFLHPKKGVSVSMSHPLLGMEASLAAPRLL